MKHLSDLFEKYKKNIKPPQASIEKECLAVIEEVTGFKLSPESVSYTISTQTLKIQAPSVVKQEIKIQQREILSLLTRKLGVARSPRIIL